MDLNDLRAIDREWLLAREVAPVLGVNPQSIRAADPVDLGFPVTKIGTRTLIPRKPFLQFVEGGQ